VQAGFGYIVEAASPVTLTMPASAGLSTGDDFRVIVHGAGAVTVAPSTAQTFDYDPAQLGWRPVGTAGVSLWNQIVGSSDGTSLVAMGGTGALYRSADSGATWTQLTSFTAQSMQAMVSSADGSVIGVGTWGQGYWFSKDSGATWTQGAGAPAYTEMLASSADGSTVYGVDDQNNAFMVSTDFGAHWTSQGGAQGQFTTSLACSTDCSTVASMDESGGIHKYTQAAGWTQLGSNGQNSGRVAMSADGSKLVATGTSGQIIYSSDAGATWAPATVPPFTWYPVAMSADGATMVAAAESEGATGAIVMSRDSGATWTVEDATARQWANVMITSDGSRPIATSQSGIFTKGDGTILAPQDASLDFVYEGNGAFFAARDAGTAFGPY